jgi:transposase
MQSGQDTDNPVTGRIVTKRRARSKLERRQVVEETLKPGASVAVIARAHGVNANQVFHWRKLYREGLLDAKPASTAELMPVRISDAIDSRCKTFIPSGAINIELGSVRVRIEGRADADTIRVVLKSLQR